MAKKPQTAAAVATEAKAPELEQQNTTQVTSSGESQATPEDATKSRESIMDKRKVTLVKMPAADAKLSTQARVILKALETEGGTLTETQIITQLTAAGLKTVQTPKRIYTFYRKALVDGGYIKIE